MQYTTLKQYMPSLEKVEALKEEKLRLVDSAFLVIVWSYFVLSLFISLFKEVWKPDFLWAALPMLLSFYLGKRYLLRWQWRYFISILLAGFTILFLIQLKGAFYGHFVLFISLTALVFYENRRLLFVYAFLAGSYNVICYLLIGIWGYENVRFYFLDSNNFGLDLAIFGTLLGLTQLILCVVYADKLQKQTLENIKTTLYLDEQLHLDANISFADALSKGELDVAYEPVENDVIGHALLVLRSKMQDLIRQEHENQWRSEGIAKVSRILIEEERLQNLADAVLRFSVNYIEAQQGILFLTEKHRNGQEPLLRLASEYACMGKVPEQVRAGEGVVGEVLVSGEQIYIDKVPDSYANISSGLGVGRPRGIFLLPLKHKGDVVGVLEIASFKEINKEAQFFLQEVGQRIAATISTVRARELNESLLRESKISTEALQAQEEEMRQNLEELQTTQEELSRQFVEVEKAKKEAEAAKLMVEQQLLAIDSIAALVIFDIDGYIIDFNSKFEQIFGYSRDELIGASHAKLLSVSYAKSKEYLEFKRNLIKKKHYEGDTIRINKQGEELHLRTGYHAITDKQGKIERILSLSYDVSELYKQQAEMKDLLERLRIKQASFEEFNQVLDKSLIIIDLNSNGTVRYINQQFSEATGYAPEEAVGKPHSFYVPEDSRSQSAFTDLWANLHKGVFLARDAKRVKKNGEIIWLYALYVPMRNEVGEMEFIRCLCTDVTKLREESKMLKETLAQQEKLSEQFVEKEKEVESAYRTLENLLLSLKGVVFKVRNDEKGSVELVTQGVESLSGYKPEVFQSGKLSWHEIVHEAERKTSYRKDRERLIAAAQPNVGQEIFYRIVAKDKSVKKVREFVKPLYNEAGQLTHFEGFITEIENKSTEI
ncbi:MAG: PAS domain S-box protein [Bernardetiaceae bacterium]|nr:PAS domain S-box protein [Bernardetiaceae bacterium]